MTSRPSTTQVRALRSAGLLYFLMAITAPWGLIYVPSKVFVRGDASATAELVRSSESLVRLGIASELFHQAIAVFLVLALYRLFRPVDDSQAKHLVVLGALVSVPIMFVNVLNEVAALTLLGQSGVLSTFGEGQRESLAYLFLDLHGQGIHVAAVFWGLWLFPFGTLIIRSGFIPSILGYLMYLAGAAYVVASLSALVLPEHAGAVGEVALIFELGEVPTLLWFFYRTVRPPESDDARRT